MEKDYILIHGKIKNINKSDDKFIWFTIFKNNYYEKDGVKNDNPSFFSARVSKDSSLKDLIKLDKNVKVEGIPCGYIDKKSIRQNYIHVTTIDNQEKIMYGYDYDGVEIFNGQRCESLPASPEEIAEMEAMINDICNNTRKARVIITQNINRKDQSNRLIISIRLIIRGRDLMTANELLELMSKVWCDTEDLIKLSGLGYVKAAYLKKEIRDDLTNKGIYLPKGKLPMSEVVKKLNIDIEHYKRIAEYQMKEKMIKTML